MATQHTRGTRLIGRQKQLELLAERLRSARNGEGSIVIVAGEAGSGKTRLLVEFCESLAEASARCAVGRCLEYIQLPYAPLLAVLGALISEDPSVLASQTHIRDALGHLVPELRSQMDSQTPHLPDKLRQFNMMAEALQRFGRERPTVAIIEDLHWADSGTLEMMLHLLPFLANSRVLIVLTHRSELARDHPLRLALAKLERDRLVFRTNLEPLDSAQMHLLVLQAMKDREALPPHLINAICAKAEGNPLFAEELLKAALGGVVALDRRLPSTLLEVIRDRFRGLSESERSTLTCAAAIGRRFRAEFLAQLLGRQVEHIIPALRHALDVDLIEEARNGAVYYSFKHELQRQAVYGELLDAEARPLHEKIAHALEAANADDHLVELSHHFWLARDPEKAAHYNERAGDAAFSVFAYGDAALNYERALQVATIDSSRRAELNLKLAKALHQSGFGQRAKEAATAALLHYESADTQRAAEICLDLAQLCFDLSDYAAVGQFAERALTLIDGDPKDPIFFAAHVELMALHTHSWDPEKARYHMKQAELFVGAPPVAAKIRFLQSKTAIEACTGFPERALEETKASAALAANSNDFRSALRVWDSFATGMAQIGEREYALRGFDEAQAIVDRHNVGGLSIRWLSIDLAQAKLQFGDLQQARQLVEQALAAGIDLPAFRLAVAETGILAGLWLEQEDLVVRCAQPDLVDFALQSSDAAAVSALASFVEWHAAQGRPGEARALLRRAFAAHQAMKSKTGPGDIYKLLVSMAAHGDDEDARQARTILEQTARTLIVRSSPAYLALIDAYIVGRKSNRSKDEMNEPALEAARMFREIGWPHYQAQALELAGKKEEALFTYRSIGDVCDAKRLESALMPVTRHGRAANELTAREREILELMVTGQTNRAIAQTLVISERTVENHVSAILAKSQVASRAELIAKRKGTPTLKGDSS